MPSVLGEVITIGDEVCRGEIVDTNSAYLASELWALGIEPAWMGSCGDEPGRMTDALTRAADRAQVVLVSGGLGPTIDDRTVEVIAQLIGQEVVVHDESLARMEAFFTQRGGKVTPNNRRQAMVPKTAHVFVNPVGLAPGFSVQLNKAVIYCVPGVPKEMRGLWEGAMAAHLQQRGGTADFVRVRRKLRTFGVGESRVDHQLRSFLDDQPGVSLHFQVAFPETWVKFVVDGQPGEEPAKVVARADQLVEQARQAIGDAVYGVGEETLAAVVVGALQVANKRVTVAESCTAGMLGALIADVPGASQVFWGGWICYENQAKQQELGVKEETLAIHGAVSLATVDEMALGAQKQSGADLSVAVSGIAGPGGGTQDKPVGTLCLALADASGVVARKEYCFPSDRAKVRRLAAFWGLKMLLSYLQEP